jgi:hypothetical protein
MLTHNNVEAPRAIRSQDLEKVSLRFHFFESKKYSKKRNAIVIRRIHITDHPPDIAGLRKIEIPMVCRSLFLDTFSEYRISSMDESQ